MPACVQKITFVSSHSTRGVKIASDVVGGLWLTIFIFKTTLRFAAFYRKLDRLRMKIETPYPPIK